ncbi:glycosyl transferase family 1 [Intrasporangium oryzae NRRL B-24470]|uniref:D-inositol 3-phosphate glycosyltransferase n=1 Tax=Intrasporangium oryzae NRRL B-24470 TaxID=1386089 RepID=W9GFX9_9MICO|nr:glycosyltransferase [Intrasporangium oryzae]EWT02784.1 glycosyl transferase family 1 [Intrasporangium oryzae NRRL B-24470]
MSHSAVVDAWRERERGLRGLGHTVSLLSARRWNEGGAPVALEPRAGEDVVGVRTWGSHPALFVYDPRPLWRALRDEWDVLDIHEEPFALSTAEILVLRALAGCRAPYVLYSAQNIDKRYPVPFRWIESWALRRAAGASVCNAEAGRIVEAKGLPTTASVIPLGTDLGVFHPGAASAPPPSVAAPGAVHVAYAGRLEPHKGVAVLLDAVAGDPRLHLSIAGAGPLEPELRRQAQTGDVTERVRFLGSLAGEDLADLYRSADVLAVPSLTTPSWVEQFGRVAVEAMACGTPVVASDSGALPDVVGDAGLLVPPGDPVALRDALLRVGLRPELAASLRAAGLRRAAATGWPSIARAYEELYRRAAGPRTAGQTDASSQAGSARPVEIIVVAYHAPDLLRRCLEPLTGEAVTVVDNSSSQQVRQVCAELGVDYVDPGRNGGFAAGVNEGLRHRRHAHSDVLLLNPDAVIEPSGIRELQRALRAQPDLASVGPAQVDGEGETSRVGWPFPSPAGVWADAVGLGRLRTHTDYVIGSILLLRAEALDQVGGLDERFFLYAEETDWARRAATLGWRHEVVRTVVARHLGSATSTSAGLREAQFHASQERYLRKHHGAFGWAVARAGHVAGSAVRSTLPGDRGRGARERLRIFVAGPTRVEAERRRSVLVPTAGGPS